MSVPGNREQTVNHIIQTIRCTLRSNRVRKQYERVEKSICVKAQLVSDLEFSRTMSNFYTERVLDIDPHKDWWAFAEAKQKQYDHRNDFTLYEKRIEEADAKVEGNKQAFFAAQRELDGLPSIK